MALIILGNIPVAAQQLSDYYTFSASPGTWTPLAGGTTVLFSSTNGEGTGAYNESAMTGPHPIGFNFIFNGVSYTQFTSNARGFMVLSAIGSSDANNSLDNPTTTGNDPVIAPYWDRLHMYNGSPACVPPVDIHVKYALSGAVGSRVLTVQWALQLVSTTDGLFYYAGNCQPMCYFQARLYECSNRIEFQYGPFRVSTNAAVNATASVGLAQGIGNFISVTPNGAGGTASGVGANNQINNNNVASSTLIDAGTIYSFSRFVPEVIGRTGAGNGGTLAMASRDTLFSGFSTIFGSPAIYTPFNLRVPANGCSSSKYSLTISGDAAADYYFGTPGTTTLSGTINAGATITPQITFKPTAVGVRVATLTIYDSSNNVAKTFYLAARGDSRITFTGNVPQGGTQAMKSGDTLLLNKYVIRFTSQNFMPFTLTNVGTGEGFGDAVINYTITGGDGQYTINPGSASLANGQSSTPTITFNANGVGPQPATLTIDADGEIRTYTLLAVSAVPSALFSIGGQLLDSNTTLFVNQHGCAGLDALSYQISVVNNGGVPFNIRGVEVYEIDTTYGQGVPRYPFRRDQLGRMIPASDYILTTQPITGPPTLEQMVNYPLTLPFDPQLSTLYLTFIGQQPGKRFARIYFRTEGQNFTGIDTNGAPTLGLLTFDLFGRGVGSMLSDNPVGGLPKTVNFGEVYIDSVATRNLTLFNPGVCTLRVSLDDMKIDQGDVEEFELVGMPDNLVDPITNDLILPPGASDTIRFTFTPTQIGSRRATVRLVTNDSSIQIPGLTERGTYYVDLYGKGRADLYANDVEFGQALIGGDAGEHRHGIVRMKSNKTAPIVIGAIVIEGPDAGEFSENPAVAWPQLPYIVHPGAEIDLGVTFAPAAGGAVGDRNAMLKMITPDGDTIVSILHGIAGTRTAATNPSAIDFGALTLGKLRRRTITITNNSTMPVTLKQPTLSPGSDFSIGMLPRLELAPGQTEYLEVTYTPSVSGPSNATMVIGSNGTNGDLQVSLSGAGLKTRRIDPVDPTQMAVRGGSNDPLSSRGGNEEELSLSGVDREEMVNGMALFTSVPNPGREMVEIGYALAVAGEVELALYDGQGRLVKVLDRGHRGSGEQRVRVDVRDLPSGAYHYRLTSRGQTLSRVLRVVR